LFVSAGVPEHWTEGRAVLSAAAVWGHRVLFVSAGVPEHWTAAPFLWTQTERDV